MSDKNSVYSFDVFDTLIGRRCGRPDRIFDLVENQQGVSDFKKSRILAESTTPNPKTFDNIYNKYQSLTKCTDEVKNNLKNAEFETELSQVFPIVSNLDLVKDGDILVSDMYLSSAQIGLLLKKVGFMKKCALFVSYDGKSTGWIWADLKKQGYSITKHYGDNKRSDVEVPKRSGIKTDHFESAPYTRSEQYLVISGLEKLANVSRFMRHQSPYLFAENTNSKYAWLEQAMLNIPTLIVCAERIASLVQSKSQNVQKVLFCTRDGNLLVKYFKLRYPNIESGVFISSRALSKLPPLEYIQYAKDNLKDNVLLVDVHGTGGSIITFLKTYIYTQPNLLFLCTTKTPSKLFLDYPNRVYFWNFLGDAMELLNVDLIGTYYDYWNGRWFNDKYELDITITKIFHDCFNLFLEQTDLWSGVEVQQTIKQITAFDSWIKKFYIPKMARKNLTWTTNHFSIEELKSLRRKSRK